VLGMLLPGVCGTQFVLQLYHAVVEELLCSSVLRLRCQWFPSQHRKGSTLYARHHPPCCKLNNSAFVTALCTANGRGPVAEVFFNDHVGAVLWHLQLPGHTALSNMQRWQQWHCVTLLLPTTDSSLLLAAKRSWYICGWVGGCGNSALLCKSACACAAGPHWHALARKLAMIGQRRRYVKSIPNALVAPCTVSCFTAEALPSTSVLGPEATPPPAAATAV